MEKELKDIGEFVSNLFAYDKSSMPAYYDDELRIKTEELSEKFKSKIFIETGSADGRNPPILNELEIYDNIHTIEIQEDWYTKFVLENNKNLEKVHCHLGDSIETLDKILSETSDDERCTIFLDAHGFELPLINELEIIEKYCTKNPPIIMIHDFFVPREDNPSLCKFSVYLMDGNNKIVDFEYIEPYVNGIYGKNEYTVEYATKSDLPNGGTGVLYIYPKIK
jgi:hypothetical protein